MELATACSHDSQRFLQGRIAERHGGSIHAELAPGGGTSIVFTLPSSALAGPGDG